MAAQSLRRIFLFPLILLVLVARPVSAQFSGAIQGTITDGQKAVVADAIVMVTNVASGVTREATTTSEGVYRVPSLGQAPIASRSSSLASNALREAVTVGVSETVRLDFALEVSGVTESVTVTTRRRWSKRNRAAYPAASIGCSCRRCRSAAGISTT